MCRYNLMQSVGTARYVVNFHDGVKTHRDGSDFFDIALFSNKRKANQLIAQLRRDGYVYGNASGTSDAQPINPKF